MKILLASNNQHKLKEIQQIFEQELPGKITILTPAQVMKEILDVEENGETLEANALLKAKAFFEKTGIPCIADDTGLEIKALNGEPGVMSARYAGEHGNDSANRKKTLKELDGTDIDKRQAQFRTVICYHDNTKIEYIEGICKGKIIFEEKGENGFGYDSLFVPEGYDRTFAEMSDDEKNAISHRGNAVKNFVRFIGNLISD